MTYIVDYGMGNLGSVANMIRRIGGEAAITSDPDVVRRADRLILPGVGSFGRAMENLHARGLVEPLTARVVGDGVPMLGVCLGMQLLSRESEESPGVAGLGWIDASTVRLDVAGTELRMPHMGWNTVEWQQNHPLGVGVELEARYYFVHTYQVRCARPENVLATARYGTDFHAAIVHGNVVGTQFHPEKSHRFGMSLMRRFLTFEPQHTPASTS